MQPSAFAAIEPEQSSNSTKPHAEKTMDSALLAPPATAVDADQALASADLSSPARAEQESDTSAEPPFKNPLLAERIGFDDGPGGFDQIDSISKQILRKEIELLKLNTRYRIESTKVGKLKPWRLFAYSLSGNTLIEVGISHIAYARWKYWQRPGLATKAFLRKGPQCLLIGHSIIVGGVMIESVLDAINDHKQAKKGFDRKTCRQRVATLKGEIEELIRKRDGSIQSGSIDSGQVAVLNLEGKVLSDVKDCAVEEFSKLAIRERKIKTARNTANLFTFAQASTGGFIGSLGNLLAVSNRKPRLALPAGVGFAVSGAFIVLTPPASKIMSIIAAKAEKKKESRFLGVDPKSAGTFDADRASLAAALASTSGSSTVDGIKRRLEIYELQNTIMDKQVLMAKAEAKANNREFVEKMISNTIAGGTKISWGTNLIVAGSDFSNTAPGRTPTLPVTLKTGQTLRNLPSGLTQTVKVGGKTTYIVPTKQVLVPVYTTYRVPIRPMKTPAQLFSRRVAQGATSNIAGPAVGVLDALQSRVRGELRDRNAKKAGTAPGQILAARLKTLEEMESKLK